MKHLFILGFNLLTLTVNQLSVLAAPEPLISEEYIKNNKGNQSSSLPVVGVIKTKDLGQYFSCFGTFQLVEDKVKNHKKYIFVLTEIGKKSPAMMNLDGKDIIMKPISTKWGKQDTLINQTYSYKNVIIRADYSIYHPPKTFQGEGNMYNIKLTLGKGRNKKVLQLRGYHGC